MICLLADSIPRLHHRVLSLGIMWGADGRGKGTKYGGQADMMLTLQGFLASTFLGIFNLWNHSLGCIEGV